MSAALGVGDKGVAIIVAVTVNNLQVAVCDLRFADLQSLACSVAPLQWTSQCVGQKQTVLLRPFWEIAFIAIALSVGQ